MSNAQVYIRFITRLIAHKHQAITRVKGQTSETTNTMDSSLLSATWRYVSKANKLLVTAPRKNCCVVHLNIIIV